MYFAFAPWKNSKRKLISSIFALILLYFIYHALQIPLESYSDNLELALIESPLSSPPTMIPYSSPQPAPPIRFQVHIFFKDNLSKLDYLWKSINAATPIAAPITFHIHAKQLRNNEKLLHHLKNLKTHHGKLESIVVLNKGVSMRDAMMKAWIPNSRNEFAIFLNYDTIVSPHVWEYAEMMVNEYYVKPGVITANQSSSNVNATKDCIGISLYALQYDQVHERDWNLREEMSNVYLHQFPSTHGAIFAPIQWTRFQKWYNSLHSGSLSLLPNSMTNRWPHDGGCKKDLIKFIYTKGKTMIYPNFPSEALGKSLISRQGNVPGSISSIKNMGSSLLQIAKPGSLRDVIKLPPLSNASIYDVYFNKKDGLDKLNEIAPSLTQIEKYEKCTLIMNVYDRVSSLLERIRHYESFQKLDRIILVWNHQKLKPHFQVSPVLRNASVPLVISNNKKKKKDGFLPPPPTYEFLVPVHILLQPNSSLNNRYLPFPEIQTDCIISMDDDFDYPHHHLEYSIKLFHGHFFNHAIGFRHMGRSHKLLEDGTFEYTTSVDKGASMVLPTGMVFHRKYLTMYTHSLPQLAREIVDSKTNGEDILFNLMVANATNSCPVVVNMFSRGIKMSSGLWQKPAHFQDRSLCLTRLIQEVYGGRVPLKFSTKFFRGIGKDGMTPSLSELNCVDDVFY